MAIENFAYYFSSYPGISEMIKKYSYTDLVQYVASACHIEPNELENVPMGGYSKGKLSGVYHFVLEDLKKNIDRYDKVYAMLGDDISRMVFTHLIQFRLVPDLQFVRKAYDANNAQYFDKDIVSYGKDEVFVDCGGFIGDTSEEYIRHNPNYKRIYIYEPSDDNIAACRTNLAKYSNITIRNCGVGEKNEFLSISNNKASSSFIGDNQGDNKIEIISLDSDIKEKVSFIKMDIVGFEIQGLLGAKNHIKNDTPKLAVCTYHILSDMWEIPLLIHSINPNYTYYFRHYMPDQNWKTVVYAIPKQVPSTASGKVPQKVLAFPWQSGWKNVELTKDCGLIPYLLHKNHGMQCTMVGAKMEPYPYLDAYVKGLTMDFLETGSIQEKEQYILNHGKETDVLLLRGAYEQNGRLATAYKKVNPAGKIYVGLDANSHWMDRILWTRPEFIQFMKQCDVIATSCKALQRHLNEKWPWNIEYIPNGYWHYGVGHTAVDFSKKSNVILTVSRLGTLQKATDDLLEAFALVAKKLPDWELRLVGSIEAGFQKSINDFFEKYPELSSQITFVGPISDKKQLFAEYLNAKVFALPSSFEGGTPNVIAEALSAGCVTAVTKFDAWEDAIDNGNCGMAVEVGNVSEIAQMLYCLCTRDDLKQLSDNAYQYALRNYDMQQITAKLYEMLFGGDMV